MPVLVVAKAPSRGTSKTRLVPPLTFTQAAALHEALLLDTVDDCRSQNDDVRLLCARAADAEALARLLPDLPIVTQEGSGLGDALRLGVARHVVDGPTAIVSSDVPGLPSGALTAAFAALADGADVVLGPALDGGYWLVAMREAHDAPFHDVPWSTPAVLGVTRRRCENAGLRLAELEPWRDVDTFVDLELVVRDLERLRAPRTVAVLRELAPHVTEPPDVRLAQSELLSGSPWRALIRDRLELDGRETTYEYLAVPRAVFVAAVTDRRELLLVRQYRHPVRDWTLEVPAGSVHDGESSLEAASRELREETGGAAREWRYLSTFYSSSAHISLRSEAWLAVGVELEGDPAPEEGENVTLVRMPLDEAVSRARSGGFVEGQTALTILLAGERLERDEGGE
ncbi:MAG: TIGR04282 family arsenosugar biosynthesis glycosyltransferase [Actinobacteria bacterium]|nr:TIGR04282 family arsenosugar biosynthesis glycosyltransferase [Actinomycetota bacterium]